MLVGRHGLGGWLEWVIYFFRLGGKAVVVCNQRLSLRLVVDGLYDVRWGRG